MHWKNSDVRSQDEGGDEDEDDTEDEENNETYESEADVTSSWDLNLKLFV